MKHANGWKYIYIHQLLYSIFLEKLNIPGILYLVDDEYWFYAIKQIYSFTD